MLSLWLLLLILIILIILMGAILPPFRLYRYIFLIGVLHHAVKLSSLVVRVRWIFDGWRRPLFRLTILSLMLFFLLIMILPLDPLSLEKSADGFNKSSIPGPIFDQLPIDAKTDLHSQENFANIFSSWPAFLIILGDEGIFNKSLSNQSNLDVVFLKASNLLPLSDWKFFNQTFVDEEVFKEVFLNETIYTEIIDNNDDKSNRSTIVQQTFSEPKSRALALKKAYDNPSLQSICYIEVAKNKGIKKQLIYSIGQNESGKNSAIEILYSISKDVLNRIYIDSEAKSEAFLLLATNSTLRYYIYRSEHPFILLFISYIWSHWQVIITLWLLLEIALWLWRLNRQIEVTDFSDDTKDFDASKKEIYEGLGAILLQNLVSMARLYQRIDEGRPIGTVSGSGTPIPAVIKAEDTSQLNSSVFSEDSKISIGGFTISASFINSLINWLSKRPKINGSLYQEKRKLILTASMNSTKSSLSWRVNSSINSVEDSSQEKIRLEVDQMVSELSYRIFSDLAFGENKITPWKAVKYFTEGLRSYRDGLHGAQDSRLNLQEAISCFENVLTWDEDFPWAHYNLGLAYSESGNLSSAEAAFRRAIELNPDSWQSYYALALNMHNSRKNDNADDNCGVVWLCKKAISLKSGFIDKAKIYDLMALAWPKSDNNRYDCIEESLLKASVFSLIALSISILRCENVNKFRDVAAKCINDLAMYLFKRNHCTFAEWLLNWALKHSSNDRNLYLDLAVVSLSNKNWKKTLDAISSATDFSNLNYWATRIMIQNEIGEAEKYPCEPNLEENVIKKYILNRFSSISSKEIIAVINALSRLKSGEKYFSLIPLLIIKLHSENLINLKEWPPNLGDFELEKGIKAQEVLTNDRDLEIWAKAQEAIQKKDGMYDPISKLKLIANKLQSQGSSQITPRTLCDEIKYAHILKALGSIYIEKDKSKDKTEDYRAQIVDLYSAITINVLSLSKKDLPDEFEIFLEDLRDEWNIPPSLLALDKERIEELVKISPLTPVHRTNLGRYYQQVDDYEQARDNFKRALLLNPNDPRIRREIGTTYMSETDTLEGSDRCEAFKQAEKYLSDACRLFDKEIYKIKTLYLIGYLYSKDKNTFPKMESVWKTAKSMSEIEHLDEEALLISLDLGDAYLNNKHYSESSLEANGLIEKLKDGPMDRFVGLRLGKEIKKGTIAVMAMLNLAMCYIEGDIKLDEASSKIDEACEIMSIRKNIDPDYESYLKMGYYDCKGWLEYKRHKNQDPGREVLDGQKFFMFQALVSPFKRTSPLQITKAILSAPEGKHFAILARKDGKIVLENAAIENAIIPELKIDNARFVNAVINKAIIKEAEIDNSTTIVYDEIKNGIIRSEDRHRVSKKLSEIPENVKGIEKATISKSSISKFEIEKVDVRNVEIISLAPGSIDKAIDYLKRSIEFVAHSLPYLHLATAYEAEMLAEKDPQKKSILREMALAACDHLRELDEDKIYSSELAKLLQNLDERDDAEEEKVKKESTSIAIKIEGTAKGELIAPPKDKA